MAESTEKKHMTSWPRVASIALIVLGLAATTAIAATVTQTPTISEPSNPVRSSPRPPVRGRRRAPPRRTTGFGATPRD